MYLKSRTTGKPCAKDISSMGRMYRLACSQPPKRSGGTICGTIYALPARTDRALALLS
jgi:hypothetical protein